MTSKRCFFNIMKEDFRHKLWMLVLSILGNLLALPVLFMLFDADNGFYYDGMSAAGLIGRAGDILSFFSEAVCASGGVIAIVGALIVGLAGFRYVFHRNMVDTYHSIPVKRRTLFLAAWLNGFLIWFVPFIVNLVAAVILGVNRLGRLREGFQAAPGKTQEQIEAFAQLTGGRLVKEAFVSAIALAIAFFLVYHLVLLAVMFCGNVLNTLVLAAVGGAGSISLYGLWYAFKLSYFDTFFWNAPWNRPGSFQQALYASPLVSSIYLLSVRVEAAANPGGTDFLSRCIINFCIALLLGLAAALIYLRRPSELAETGVRNRPVKFVVQILTSLVAGLGGWLIFYSIVPDPEGVGRGLVWGIFGLLFVGILVFGVMDIVFRMDFKAFFAHRLLMAGMMAASLLICLGFCFDWTGYDTYLPEKEMIQEIAVLVPGYSARGYGYDVEILDEMHFTDADAAYAYLERAVAHYQKDEGAAATQEDWTEGRSRSGDAWTKVTLKNGKSYYRAYSIFSYDSEAALKLLASREYTDLFFRLTEEDIGKAQSLILRRGGEEEVLIKKGKAGSGGEEELRKICEAYNQDLEESPELIIRDESRILAGLILEGERYSDRRYITLYEGMSHTREALRECGLGSYADFIPAEDVSEIRLYVNIPYGEGTDGLDGASILKYAREEYLVYDGEGPVEEEKEETYIGDAPAIESYTIDAAVGELYYSVRDPEEIEELLGLVSFGNSYSSDGLFGKVRVGHIELIMKGDASKDQDIIIDKEGRERNVFSVMVYEGTLPEKYILRFGNLTLE